MLIKKERFHFAQEEEGQLMVDVTDRVNNRPIDGASVSISYVGDPQDTLEQLTTDSNGMTEEIDLAAPPRSYSEYPLSDVQPYSEYNLIITAPGYEPTTISGSEIFSGELSVQPVRLNPVLPNASASVINIPANTLWGVFPPKIPEDEIKPVRSSGEIVLSRVVIPEYIVVHDGVPSDSFLNMENVENGSITIDRKKQPKDSYTAGNSIYAGYIATEYYPVAPLLVNLGVRYEISKQWVDYYTDGGKAERSELNKNDLFPSLNMKYQMNEKNSLRFAFSRTVTRPSFIEMAPFLYQESYGSAQIRGNADLQNGYNYNIDLRYELFEKNGDMLSITAYYKHLKAPIERVQTLSGGSAVHSFRNADNGMATGVEIEFRKEIVKDLRFGVNGSYMYTNVKLPEGGAYTNSQRALQGASPYLANADLTYSPAFSNDRQLSVALLYNLQGPRIHSVGISGLGDIKQQPVHTLNFTGSYRFNRRFAVKLQVNDLLNQDILFKQEVPTTGDKVEVERFRKGTGFEVGFSYDL